MFEREIVVDDQRMVAERGERALARARIDRGAVVFSAFDEECHDRRRDIPPAVLNRLVEKAPISLCSRQQPDIFKAAEIHSQAAWIFEKKLRMRALRDQAAGAFSRISTRLGNESPPL